MPEVPTAEALSQQPGDFEAELRLLRALDGLALGRLYDRYHTAVYRYVAVRVRRIEDAEDLTEEVFVAAIQSLPRLQAQGGHAGLAGWLLRIARNKVVDHYRRSSLRETSEIPETVAAPAGAEPEAQVAQLFAAQELKAALEQLTEEQREVLVAKYVLGYDNMEIAASTGRTPNAVNALHYRGLAALRRILEGRGVQ
jgi:RNA polymerase sigma-70 factor (ECF subfamily)